MDHLNERTAAKHLAKEAKKKKKSKRTFRFCHFPLAEPGVVCSIYSQHIHVRYPECEI